MTMKTTNEILDEVLSDLYRERNSRFNPELYLKQRFKLENQNAQEVYEKLRLEHLIDSPNRKPIKISDRGMKIQSRFGGWLAYLHHQEENEEIESERQQKEDEKLDIDLTLAKWQKRFSGRFF